MLTLSAREIAAVMVVNPLPESMAELEALVHEGLPKSALREVVSRITQDAQKRSALLKRIDPDLPANQHQCTLTLSASKMTERLARVYATAVFVWTNADDARCFLDTRHPLLEERSPLEVSLEEAGARRVEELLWQIFYGLPN